MAEVQTQATAVPLTVTSASLLKHVQELVLAQDSAPLSDYELSQLSILNGGPLAQPSVRKGLLAVLNQALAKKVVAPDRYLPYLLMHARGPEAVIPIAMALRAKDVDPNVYIPIRTAQGGTADLHSLAYVSQGVTDPATVQTIQLLLLTAGAQPGMPVYRASAGQTIKSSIPSVAAYLRERGKTVPKLSDPEATTNLGYLLGRSELLRTGTAASVQTQQTAVAAHTPLVTSLPLSNDYVGLDYRLLVWCVDYLNLSAWLHFIDRGLVPSYALVNRLLLLARNYREWPLIKANLQAMLIQAVKRGTKLDQQQYQLYQQTGLDVTALDQAYNTRYVDKACSITEGLAPRELRTIAESLGLSTSPARPFNASQDLDPNSSRAVVCQQLKRVAALPEEQLQTAAHARSQQLFQARNVHLDELAQDPNHQVKCTKSLGLKGQVTDYAPRDVAYYRQGDQVHCFGRPSFAQLIAEKKDPLNGQMLPGYFIKELEAKSRLWSRNQPLSSTIKEMLRVDQPTDQDSQHILELFLANARLKNTQLSPSQVQTVLGRVGYAVVTDGLTQVHAMYTLARVAEFLYLYDNEAYQRLVASLR